jgi:AraC-like DNA-binding protein
MRSTRSIDYQDVPRPVAAMAIDYPPGHVDARHRHRRAQLLYSTTGVLSVTTDEGRWVVPPQRAVWLPGGTDHEILCRGQVSFRTLYVEPAAHPELPAGCRVIKVSDLLRALILEAIRMPIEYDLQGRDGRVMALILDEIVSSVAVPLHVPMPQDKRLVRICMLMQQDPADDRDLDDWAREAGMARRTLTRLFRDETGMSFAAWRQQIRLLEALARLAIGQPITAVALDVGYNSPSAFTAMFRRVFGTTPSQYLD